MWQVITGLFQVAGGIIMALVSVITAFITGDWNKAHDQLVKGTMMAWDGIKNIFSGIIGFISNWGGSVLSNLVRPFQDAWNRIQDIVNKIKDALDFTKRHSPSVLDIVKRGVGLVNNAMSDLLVTPNMDTQMVAQTVANGGQNMSVAAININLDGAIIGNEYEASSLAERIGDGIIEKLRYSVRI
jgi:phage-related protein